MNGNRKVELTMPTTLDVPAGGVSALSTVKLPVAIGKTNTGFTALHIIVSYDSTKLTYQGFTISDSFKLSGGGVQSNVKESNGSISIVLTSAKDVKLTEGSLLFELSFSKATGGSVSVGDTTQISASISTNKNAVVNQSSVSMTASITSTCTATFIDGYNLGDVNMDGSVDLLDATWVLQYYNGIRTFTKDQIILGDVNSSGGVTLVDALMIMKKYNGTITSFS
jgi:hypothetical protein